MRDLWVEVEPGWWSNPKARKAEIEAMLCIEVPPEWGCPKARIRETAAISLLPWLRPYIKRPMKVRLCRKPRPGLAECRIVVAYSRNTRPAFELLIDQRIAAGWYPCDIAIKLLPRRFWIDLEAMKAMK